MSEVFQIRCPSCNSKLNAKASLEGQTRNCPKCKTPILIQRYIELDEPEAPPAPIVSTLNDSVRPQQLEFQNRYMVLGHDRVVAAWEGSKGWLINVGSGFGPARNNMSSIPDNGVFAFVEMIMDSGIPKKLQISKISVRGALLALYRDAHSILGKLEESVELTAAQKDALLRYLRQVFMSSVLDGADAVIAYLTSPSS